MNILSPSLLAVDFGNIEKNIKVAKDKGALWLHLDVMDGMFVPNISFGPPVIESIRKISDMFFDVHLMIEEPIRYIDAFKAAGADMITVHYEACKNLKETIYCIKQKNIKAGVAISPNTDVKLLENYIADIDMALVMSVEPGFGGQKFIEASLDKVKAVKNMAERINPDLYIEVDGGITRDNVKAVLDAGCNVVVAGSSVFKGDVGENVSAFLKLMNG